MIEHKMLSHVVTLLQHAHVLLVGPTQCGKTTLVEQAAARLGRTLYSHGPVADKFELTGFVNATGTYQPSPMFEGFTTGGLVLFDEIDASEPMALLTSNAALANGHMTFPHRPEPFPRHGDFRAIATANTFGRGADRAYQRNQLDASTLERFVLVEVDYDEELERRLCPNYPGWVDTVQRIRAATRDQRVNHFVSTRSLILGGKYLADGMRMTDVARMLLKRDLDDTTWARIGGR